MKKALLIICIISLILGMSQGLRVSAWLADIPYTAYNAQLEGAKILELRSDLLAGNLPSGRDLWLVGTSRTMADFSANLIAQELASRLGLSRKLQAYNLGNLSNSYAQLANLMQDKPFPRLLVLEFSPHVMSESCTDRQVNPSGGINGAYARYRFWIAQKERLVSGWVRRICSLEGLPRLSLVTWNFFKKVGLPPNKRSQALYYGLRSAEGNSPILQDDGQIYYWSYIASIAGSRLVSSYSAPAEMAMIRQLLKRDALTCQWQGIKRLLEQANHSGCRVVVVRPPVSSQMYLMENRLQNKLVEEIKRFLSLKGITYLDLNPNTYSSTDGSHIDWFETARLSRKMGGRLAQSVTKELFADQQTTVK